MASVRQFDRARSQCAPADQCGIVATEHGFAKNPVRARHELVERQVKSVERTEKRVQVRGEHRGRNAFSRGISKYKEYLAVALVDDQIAIVAADRTCRRVVVIGLPVGGPRTLIW